MSINTTDEYNLLIEFVHKHMNFHDAELDSILDMHDIKLGVDCHFRTLPIDDNDRSSSELTRPFNTGIPLEFHWGPILSLRRE